MFGLLTGAVLFSAVFSVPSGHELLIDRPLTLDGHGIVIRGAGFPESKKTQSGADALVRITASNVTLKNFVIEDAPNYGLVITGHNNTLENVTVKNCWRTCLLIDGGDGNTLRYVEASHSRHGSGISIGAGADGAKNNLIYRSISRHNGRLPNGEIVPAIQGDPQGGGNSDGFNLLKDCADNFTKNPCTGNRWLENIAYSNTDDGGDFSAGDGTVIEKNIFWDNGPRGGRGIKLLRPSQGTITVRNNQAGQHFRNFEFRFGGPAQVENNTAISEPAFRDALKD